MHYSLLILSLIFSIKVSAKEPLVVPETLLKQVEQGNAEVAYYIASQFVQRMFDMSEVDASIDYEQKAKAWMQKAAEMQYPQAILEWAEMLESDEKEIEALNWYQKASDMGVSEAKERIASFHLFGLGGLVRDCKVAYEWFEKAQVFKNKLAYNDHAWSLATSAYKACRNPEKALLLMSKLMSLYGQESAFIPSAILDTQAAVYASVSDFNRAIKVQKLAIKNLGKAHNNFKSYQERLETYQKRKPWIQKKEM